ncbi:uncharacterized protein [Montipora capricornis]|uniref:uncharacterized protein n=1 Tax=Montipora capricornis TaxID=246305 RepID=UPI0035F1A3A4
MLFPCCLLHLRVIHHARLCSWCQRIPPFQPEFVRSLFVYFRTLRVKRADILANHSFSQYLFSYRNPEEKGAAFNSVNSILSPLGKRLPVMEKTEKISVEHSDDIQTLESTSIMKEPIGVFLNQSCLPSDYNGLPSGESKNLSPDSLITSRSSGEITTCEVKNDHPVTDQLSGESSGVHCQAVTMVNCDSDLDLISNESTFRVDEKVGIDSDSLGLGTLFNESLQGMDEKRMELQMGKIGDNDMKEPVLGNNDSFGLENLFDENLQCKGAARHTVPKIRQTSKQRKKEKRKWNRNVSGISGDDDDDDDDDADAGGKNLNKTDTPSSKHKKKPKRIIPNYFVAVRVSNPDIHSGVKIVQDSIVTHNEKFKPALIPLATLHLTLLVVHLEDERQIEKAAEVLNQCRTSLEPILQNGALRLIYSGLDHFRHQVLFVKLGGEEEFAALMSVANIVREMFEKEGMPSTDSRDFKPHLTVMKLSRSPNLRKKGIKSIPVESYSNCVDFKFGEEPVNALYLCSMNAKDEDGFYSRVASLQFHLDGGLENSPKDMNNTMERNIGETITEHTCKTSESSLSCNVGSASAEDYTELGDSYNTDNENTNFCDKGNKE